jgi:pilus assembly protein TadC
MRNDDSVEVISDYLNNNYLRGFWNRFEMRLNAAPQNSDLFSEYQLFLQEKGIKIKQTHFYSIIPVRRIFRIWAFLLFLLLEMILHVTSWNFIRVRISEVTVFPICSYLLRLQFYRS